MAERVSVSMTKGIVGAGRSKAVMTAVSEATGGAIEIVHVYAGRTALVEAARS